MKYGVSGKLAVGLGVALLMMSGCTGPETGSDEGVGTARVRIEAARTDNFEITQVTVTALGGFQADLTRDSNGGFIGTLLLPAGFNELTGLAFAGNELVGVSSPVPVQIQAGLVTGATIRILDATGGEDVPHSPIVLSLSHPLSALSNQPVLLSTSAVDPDGDPLSVFWSTDCADAVLFSPGDFFTDFVKPTAGTCRVDVTVSDGGLSSTESFQIVVFDPGQATGAVNVDGSFVSAPQIFLDLDLPGPGSCNLFDGSFDGTCQGSIASPTRAATNIFVDWGNAQPGFIQLFDNCGGTFEFQFSDPFFLQAQWRPPVFDTVCLVTAQAFSNDGVFNQLSAAVRVTPGVAPSQPQISASLSHSNGVCELQPGQDHVFCDAPIQASSLAQFFTGINWGSEPPGGISLGATCGQFFDLFGDQFFLQGTFQAPPFETPCTIFIDAFGPNGNIVRSASIDFNVAGAPQNNIQAFVSLENVLGQCVLNPGQNAVDCGPVRAGGSAFLHAEIFWNNALPGQIQVSDNCGGAFQLLFNDPFVTQANWFTPFAGGNCTVQVSAFSGDGQARTFELFVPLSP
jgi:hypothetical protein